MQVRYNEGRGFVLKLHVGSSSCRITVPCIIICIPLFYFILFYFQHSIKKTPIKILRVRFIVHVLNVTFNNTFFCISALLEDENWSTRRKPPTYRNLNITKDHKYAIVCCTEKI